MSAKKSILFIVPLSIMVSACSSVNLRLPAPLSRCETPLGTVALAEHRGSLQQYGLTSPTAILKKIMEQGNCFTVASGPNPRGNWTITPALSFENFSREAASTLETVPVFGGLINRARGALGGEEVAFLEATAKLSATGRKAANVEGTAKRSSLSLFGFSGLDADFEATGGAYTQTEAGKIATFAFMQAHNRLVKALRPTPTR